MRENKRQQYTFFEGCKDVLKLKAIDSMLDFNQIKGKDKARTTLYISHYDVPKKWNYQVLKQMLTVMNKVVAEVTRTRDLIQIAVKNYAMYDEQGFEGIQKLYKAQGIRQEVKLKKETA
jgi:hypothetical protein